MSAEVPDADFSDARARELEISCADFVRCASVQDPYRRYSLSGILESRENPM